MKVLFVTPEIPHRAGGGAKRMFEQLEHLARAGVSVDVLSYGEEGAGGALPAAGVYRYDARETLRGRLKNLLAFRAYTHYPGFAELLSRVIDGGRYDIAHVHKFQMAEYFTGERRLPVVIDLWGCGLGGAWRDFLYETDLPLKAAKLLRLPRYYLADRALYPAFENYFVVSEEARRYVLDRYPGKHVYVVPHGVDLPKPSGRREVSGRELLFVGDMSFSQNIDTALYFYREIFPALRSKFPDAKFTVVGRAPVPAVLALKADPAVEVTGFVDEIGPYLDRAAVFVAPIRTGLGLRTKILESFAHRLPVVTTRNACEGIPVRDGREAVLAETPEEFISGVARLLDDRELAASIGENALALVTEHYDWGRITAGMVERYDEILHSNNIQR
jgi:glycosyltransferase involved in cell wall biosynthesis